MLDYANVSCTQAPSASPSVGFWVRSMGDGNRSHRLEHYERRRQVLSEEGVARIANGGIRGLPNI